jgi:protein ImuA
MRASVSMAGDVFVRLSRQIAAREGKQAIDLSGSFASTGPRPAAMLGDLPPTERSGPPAGPKAQPSPARLLLSPRRGGAVLPLGIAALDRLLGGGLRRNALHEVRSAITRDNTAATGFAAAILARLAVFDDRPILFVAGEDAAKEGGLPYGPGFDRFGLDSRRLVLVSARRPAEVLWVFEEGLRCPGLAAVLAELRGSPRALDLTASRRLSLRAGENGVMGLLLRQSGPPEPGAAATRWRVTPLPAATVGDFPAGIGRPVFRLALERNRAGPTGSIDLEWDHGARSFAIAVEPALSFRGSPLSCDRPYLAGEAGAVLAFRRAG